MSGKDGKNDPQDGPQLFPITGEERQKCYQRMAENLLRMRELQTQIASSTTAQKEEIARLKRANAALLEELATHATCK